MPKFLDNVKIGQRFGKYTVIGPPETINRHIWHMCGCDCGREVNVRKDSLTSGKSTKCRSCAGRTRAGFEPPEALVGRKYNNWTVDEYLEQRNNVYFYKCTCRFGKKKIVSKQNLIKQTYKSCRDCDGECKLVFDPKDIVGRRFGKWIVLEYVGWKKYGHFYKCRCDCGNESELPRTSLTQGTSKSCGKCKLYLEPWIEQEEDHYRYHCTNGNTFIFSPCDLELAKSREWIIDTYGYPISEDENNRIFRFTRMALDAKEDEYVDHISMDTYDERRSNLRKCTWSENNCNKKLQSNNISGYKGVSFSKVTGKYIAVLWKDGKRYYGGLHNDPKDAAHAYDDLAKQYHGEFARLNFPKENERSCHQVG